MDTVKKKRAASREPARSGEGGGLFEGGKDKFPFRW